MSEWISCAERLPEERGRYIIYHWYMDAVQINFWDDQKWEYDHRATHWMPLPPKPNDSTEIALSLGIAIVANGACAGCGLPLDGDHAPWCRTLKNAGE